MFLRESDDRVPPAVEDDEVAETDRELFVELGPPPLVLKNGFCLKSGDWTGDEVIDDVPLTALARSLPFQDDDREDRTPAPERDVSRDRLPRRCSLARTWAAEASSAFRAVSLNNCKLTLALRPAPIFA